MKTGPFMQNMLTYFFLLIAAHCLESSIIRYTPFSPAEKMNWTEARLFCQKNYIDLVTWNVVDKSKVTQFLKSIGVEQAWIGLLRDPEKESAWRWINLESGEGISGNDLSQSSDWFDGEENSHCAVVAADLKWYSEKCSNKHGYYCSELGTIHYYIGPASWNTAYCRYRWYLYYLATITTANTDQFKNFGWIGLFREGGETWKWIGGHSSDYRNWAPGESRNADCGSFDPPTEKWYSKVCSEELRFVCYDDGIVVVNENKTWEDALSHCRSMETPCEDPLMTCIYQHELLSLEVLSDYTYAREKILRATTDEVWTGLRFLGGEWHWTNGQKLEDQGMLPDCPSQWKHCGTLSKYDTNNWITRDCSEKRNFICYREKFLIIAEDPTTPTITV